MKILLIDHHALFRDGLRNILQQLPGGVDEILEAGSFPDGMRLAGQHPGADMALLELKSPGSDGALSVKHFHLRYPHIPLVVVSSEEDGRIIVDALSNGASGYVCKSSAGTVLLDALKQTLSGSIHVPPHMLRQPGMPAKRDDCLNESRRSNSNDCGLTARQMDILRCLIAGLSNKDIARATDLAEGTVKAHVAAVFQILRVKNRMEAIRVARLLGLADCAMPEAEMGSMQVM